MLAPAYPWSLRCLLQGRPSIGGLMDLCEENYRTLLRIAPELGRRQGHARSSLPGGMDLHLEILEQTRYTTLIHLTYYFAQDEGAVPDPDTRLRCYHDARQVEVLDLRQSVLPLNRGPHLPTLEQKWKVNLFLSKWLTYCVRQGHGFAVPEAQCALSGDASIALSC